jgi:hypothetical protein
MGVKMNNQKPFYDDKKLQTQSLARTLLDDGSDLLQMKQVRDAAYKAGFAMAASIVQNYLKETQRYGEALSSERLLHWAREAKLWRNQQGMKDVPEVM